MNNDDISHFSTIPTSFAIKSNVCFIAHQYLIINNSQSQRALSVSVRTVYGYILLADETVVFYLNKLLVASNTPSGDEKWEVSLFQYFKSLFVKTKVIDKYGHGSRNRGGGQGGGGNCPLPNILPTQKIQECINNNI